MELCGVRVIEAECMGRYIDDILQPGEKVLYSTNAHWIFYLPAIAAWLVAGILLILSRSAVNDSIVLLCLSASAVAGNAPLYSRAKAWVHPRTTPSPGPHIRAIPTPRVLKHAQPADS